MTDQPAAESTTLIEIDLWSDLVCPWSWMAKRRLEAAVAAFERPTDVSVRLRAYELDPELPVGGAVPVSEHLALRYAAGDGGGDVLTARVSDAAADDDLRFDWDRAVRASTFDAHRLCALALELGGPALQSAAVERFHAAHFSEGLAIDDHRVLLRAAEECGLDERRVAAVLAGDDYADVVRADEQAARALGVTSVPVVVANGLAALGGARTAEDYLALLRGVATHG
ncbi:MAG: DsbA family oxidoreductase [Terracoccus sp.]